MLDPKALVVKVRHRGATSKASEWGLHGVDLRLKKQIGRAVTTDDQGVLHAGDLASWLTGGREGASEEKGGWENGREARGGGQEAAGDDWEKGWKYKHTWEGVQEAIGKWGTEPTDNQTNVLTEWGRP